MNCRCAILRPADDGRCSRRLRAQRRSSRENIIPLNRISAISNVYQSLLPPPTNSGASEQLSRASAGGVQQRQLQRQNRLQPDGESAAVRTLHTRQEKSAGTIPGNQHRRPQTVLPLPYTDTRLVTEIPTVFQVKHSWTITPIWSTRLNFGFQPLLCSHHERHLGR